jgi:hypothetical protein
MENESLYAFTGGVAFGVLIMTVLNRRATPSTWNWDFKVTYNDKERLNY